LFIDDVLLGNGTKEEVQSRNLGRRFIIYMV